jgi:hypothetical protein
MGDVLGLKGCTSTVIILSGDEEDSVLKGHEEPEKPVIQEVYASFSVKSLFHDLMKEKQLHPLILIVNSVVWFDPIPDIFGLAGSLMRRFSPCHPDVPRTLTPIPP